MDGSLLRARLDGRLSWSTGDYLAALQIDYLAQIGYSLGGKGRKPKPLPRPEQHPKSKPIAHTTRAIDEALSGPREPLTAIEEIERKANG